MATNLERRPSPEIESRLYAVAYLNGNIRAAAEHLGVDPSRLTKHVERWQRRYAEICDEIEPERRQRLAARAEDALAVAIEGVEEGIELVKDDLKDLSAKERHTALRNLATTGALLNDKMIGPMRNRPTQVIRVEKSTPAELWAEFSSMFPGVVNSTAEEEGLNTEAPALPTGAPGSSEEEGLDNGR